MGYYEGMIAWREQQGAPILPTGSILGHQAEFSKDPIATMLRAQHERGDLVRMRFGPFWFHLLSDPAEAYAVLVEKHKIYSKRTPGYDMLRLLLGEGLVTSEGELWRRQRRIAQPAFRKQEISALTEVMSEATEDMARTWQPIAAQGGYIDISAQMARLTLRIAGETLFGIDLSDDSAEVGRAMGAMLTRFTEMIMMPFPFIASLPTPRNLQNRKALAELDRVVHEIIAEHRRAREPQHTLLTMLIDARDEDGKGMSDKQLRDEVITILLAGHETTANALTWTFFLLSKHPEVRRRLEAEIDEALAGRTATMADIPKLGFAAQVIKESMRLYPPVWTVGRRCEEDDEVCGYRVPKGGLVLMSPYVLHRHPDVWENPEGFDPDRFAADRPVPPRGAYMPFIVGPRKCIGEHFAMTEAVIVLTSLLARYRLDLVPGHKIEMDASVTLRPRSGIKMRLQPR